MWMWWLALAWASTDVETVCAEMGPARDAMDPEGLTRTAEACLAAATEAQDLYWLAEAWDTRTFARFFAGDLPGALEAAQTAIALWEEHGGPHSVDAAYSRLQLAKLMGHSGQWEQALSLVEAAAPVLDAAPDMEIDAIDAHELAGTALLSLGQADAAYARRRALLPRLEALEGPESEWTLDLLLAVAESAADTYHSSDALELLEECRERLAAYPDTHELRRRHLLLEGIIRYNLGDYGAGRRLSQELIELLEAMEPPASPLELASARLNLATIFADHGDPEAIGLAEQAVAEVEGVVGPEHPQLVPYLLGLANALRAQERDEQARGHTGRALAIAEALLPADSPRLAMPLTQHAMALKNEEPDRARALAERAATLAAEAGSVLEGSQALSVAGQAAEVQGDHAAAEDFHQRSVVVLEAYLPEGHPMPAYHRSMWGRARARAGDWAGAVQLQRDTLALLSEHSDDVVHLASVRERLAAVRRIRLSLDRYLAWGTSEPVAQAWEAGLRIKGLVGRSMAARATGRDAQRSELTRLRARISSMTWSASPDADELAALTRQKEALEREIGVSTITSAGPDAICAALDPDEALVDMFRVVPNLDPAQPDGSVLAFVARGGPDCLDTLQRLVIGEEAALQQVVGAYRLAVERRLDPLAIEQTGRALREAAWDALAPLVAGARHVHIAADGPLVLVPWGGLPTEDGGFLLETHRFSVQSSAEDVLPVPPPEDRAQGALVVGGVDYGEAEVSLGAALALREARCLSEDLPPLPATAEEADAVSRSLARLRPAVEPQVLSGTDATVAAVEQALGSARIAHLATHGFFADERCRSGLAGQTARAIGHNPLALAGLALAHANEPTAADDGLWTAEEASSLDLSHVELVVLSACESGLGVQRAGEGLLGVRQALRVAGARAVVSTMWSVPDGPTRDLMTAFYREYARGNTTASQALHRAQLKLLRQGRAQGDARPDAWAAFVVTGR